MIIGTAGHVDHGKTRLVRALTGVDTDRLPEERRRGMTIELGFAPLALESIGVVGVVDVPGHDAFVRTMVAGAAGIDIALLVVAADEGAMPQTYEHLAVLELLGVRRGVVALTKRDLVDDDWYDLVHSDVRRALDGTFLSSARCVPVSASTGQGIGDLITSLTDVAIAVPPRADDALSRMPIDRAFTVRGIGTVVTGTLLSGEIVTGAVMRLFPSGREVRVRGLESHGNRIESAGAGNRVAVVLPGVARDEVVRGSVLVSGGAWTPSQTMRGDVTLLPDAPGPLSSRTRLRLHLGTADVAARVVCDGQALQPGQVRPARIVLASPLVARAGDRFVLRRLSPPSTIGGGTITDPIAPARRARAFPGANLSDLSRLTLLAGESGVRGVGESELRIRVAAPSARAEAVFAEAVTDAVLVRVGDVLIVRSALDRECARICEWLDRFHLAHPDEEGASTETVRSTSRANPTVTEHVLRSLESDARVERIGSRIRLAGWRPSGASQRRVLRQRVVARLLEAGAQPPSGAELAREFGASVARVLGELEADGLVVSLGDGMFATPAAASSLRERVVASIDGERTYRPSDLRDLFGMTRRHLVPWLEYFDRIGFSSREGDLRRFRR